MILKIDALMLPNYAIKGCITHITGSKKKSVFTGFSGGKWQKDMRKSERFWPFNDSRNQVG